MAKLNAFMTLKIGLIAAVVVISFLRLSPAEAQRDEADASASGAAVPASGSSSAPFSKQRPGTATTVARRDGIVDPFNPGWATTKFKYGIGYGSGFLSSPSTVFIFEKFENSGSFSFYLGFQKSADGYTQTDTTAAALTTTTKQTSRSGTRNPFSITLGTSYNKPIYRNDWLMVRWGVYGGLDYYFKTSYDTGSRTEVFTNASGDSAITESGYGSATVSRDAVFKVGPVVDSYFFIRWFPQLAVGLQGGMLYGTPAKVTTDQSARSRTYNRIGGVDQAPSTDTTTNSTTLSDPGSAVGTFAVNGSVFNAFGNFVLRYVW